MKSFCLGLFALCVIPLLPACEEPEDPPPSIVDKSAQDAAALTTEVACGYVSRCGIIEVSCADCADGADCGGCTVEQVPVSMEECAEDFGPELTAGFSCEPLTAEQEARVDECLAVLTTAECPAIEEVEDWSNGGDLDDPRDELAACDVFEEIMERCYDPSEPPSVGEPEPAPAPLPG